MAGRTQVESAADATIRDAMKAGGPAPFLANPSASTGQEIERIANTLNRGESDALMSVLRQMGLSKRRRPTAGLTEFLQNFA